MKEKNDEINKAVNNNKYISPFSYNIIYIFRAIDQGSKYENLLKIGKASITTDKKKELIYKEELDLAARKRIDEYTKTSGFQYQLLWTELAINKNNEAFSDIDVHHVLENSDIHHVVFDNNNAREWFRINLEVAKIAIKCVIEGKKSLPNYAYVANNEPEIILREEQQEAISKALRAFKTQPRKCLWNCKMRFGKTICALHLIADSLDFPHLNFKKILIITNRPSVVKEWFDDYKLFFAKKINYTFFSKYGIGEPIGDYITNQDNAIVFASGPDLKGNETFQKNHNIDDTNWDLVIIDEAHEGWLTPLGDKTLARIFNKKILPCKLYLSGTPFNIENNFDENQTYTWNYLDEQKAKLKWYLDNAYSDDNPYGSCPQMLIYTLNLDELTNGKFHIDDNNTYFNFNEFFRVNLDNNSSLNPKFVHEEEIKTFLNKLHSNDDKIQYPFNPQFRDYFHHTLWLVPGVMEAKALVKLLKEDEIFSAFKIIDVTGNDINASEAVDDVKQAIGIDPSKTWTITITCDRLTVGTTIKPWTAILYLAGGSNTSRIKYLQSIFRVQSACDNFGGMVKNKCYVFDFAPNRVLKVIASQCIDIATREHKNSVEIMKEWLDFMAVISLSPAKMRKINEQVLFDAIAREDGQKIYDSGFQDNSLFDFSKLGFSNEDLDIYQEMLKEAKIDKKRELTVNKNKIAENGERIKRKNDHSNSEEEKLFLEKKIILKQVTKRLPLLIYGSCDLNQKFINLIDLIKNIDDCSWVEFMPPGLTKENFLTDFAPCIKIDKFNWAAKALLTELRIAQSLSILDRIIQISNIFSKFHNPDKETVLTPWRVVNLQLGSCIGGYTFFDSNGEPIIDPAKIIYPVNLVDVTKYNVISNVTNDIFRMTHKFLDINSKTGLYSLYLGFSLFELAKKNGMYKNQNEWDLWKQIVENNLYSLCRTPMAKTITKRTLVGVRSDIKVNAYCPENGIKLLIEKNYIELNKEITNPANWGKDLSVMIKFDAIVGNPPYNLLDEGKNVGSKGKAIYPNFFMLAKSLNPKYISLIMPRRWTCNENTLVDFKLEMTNNFYLTNLYSFAKSRIIFPDVEIDGGVMYFLWQNSYHGVCSCYKGILNQNKIEYIKYSLTKNDIQGDLIDDPNLLSIKKQVWSFSEQISLQDYVSKQGPYGISTNFLKTNKNDYSITKKVNTYPCEVVEDKKRTYIYIYKNYNIVDRDNLFNKWKVFMAEAYGCEAIGAVPSTPVLSTPILSSPGTICSDTFLQIGGFLNSEEDALNLIKYIETKFFRCLVGIKKIGKHSNQVYKYVPMQDFTNKSDIDWSRSLNDIDEQLFKKYNLNVEDINFIKTNIEQKSFNYDKILN